MKTRKIISILISAIMLMQILMTGTFTASAQTTIETLAKPTNISYSDNTIAWTHNKENIKTFRVNFYALSTDGEYFHMQSNYDGDLKTNTSFSIMLLTLFTIALKYSEHLFNSEAIMQSFLHEGSNDSL